MTGEKKRGKLTKDGTHEASAMRFALCFFAAVSATNERISFMNKQSLRITTGAMVTAIFGAMLLLNRQTGGLFQEFFVFLYPIPMVAYAALYGLKNGAAVCVSMALLSCLLGDFTSIFYAASQAIIGLLFGGCLYHKVDMTKTLFAVMLLSALISVLNLVLYGFLSGVDWTQELLEMQTMMNSVFEQTGMVVPETMMSLNTLKQIMIVSMIFSGLLQGFVVYELSLMILRRLRFPVQKPKSVFSYTPPSWTGYLALLAFFAYNRSMVLPFENEMVQNLSLSIGMFGYIYLLCFGFLAVLRFLKTHYPNVGKWSVVLTLVGLFVLPVLELFAGFWYIIRRKNDKYSNL